MEINEQLQPVIEQIVDRLRRETESNIADGVKRQLANFNVRAVVEEVVRQEASKMISTLAFPPGSISHESVNFGGVRFSGNHIRGGVIEDFGSTGIDDRATHTQLTVMDHAVVFESPLVSSGLDIRGDASILGTVNINGDINITGQVNQTGKFFKDIVDHSAAAVATNLNQELFTRYSDLIFKKISEEGVDLDKIRHRNREVINENGIAYHIVDSNLQRVGMLKDLQTQGETLLSETFFVGNKRAGVNTLEPSATFVVWDHECELVVCKRSENQGFIGTQRYQSVVLGANNKENILLHPEGSTVIKSLTLNNIPMTSGATVPSHEGQRGQIVWNENPNTGSAIGWVCLGKNQWGSFGRVE